MRRYERFDAAAEPPAACTGQRIETPRSASEGKGFQARIPPSVPTDTAMQIARHLIFRWVPIAQNTL
jgi:hypothetical protein